MKTENTVFKKIKEISARSVHPRPHVATAQIANELSMASGLLMPCIGHLKQLRLVSFCDSTPTHIKLTLLGCVVVREK